MHLYRIAAQITLTLSILNLVLGAPVQIVPEIPEASDDSPPSLDTMASPQHPPSLDGYPDSEPPAPPQHPPSLDGSPDLETMASPQRSSLGGSPDLDAVASPQRSPSLDGETSSGYPTPHLSSASSASGNSWMLERPPRLSPGRPPSPYATASDGSLTSHYFTASDGLESSHNSEGYSFSPPESAGEGSQKKYAYIFDLVLVGGALGLWGLQQLHHKHHGSRDS